MSKEINIDEFVIDDVIEMMEDYEKKESGKGNKKKKKDKDKKKKDKKKHRDDETEDRMVIDISV